MNAGKEARAVIYCRQSRDASGQGAAVERQEEACRALAVARGYQVVGVEVDNSISATTGARRPGWEHILTRIEEGSVDVVVAYHLDRITRTMTDLEQLILSTERHGVGVATCTGDIDLTNDTGRMVARILAAVARQEVERKGERQRLANQQRVSRGRPRWAHRPFGYEKDRTFREPEAELLRAAYGAVLEGRRISQIRDDWNTRGVTTTRGNQWDTRNVGKLLRDPRNAGLIRYQGEVVGRGDWEPIVPEEQWRVALERLRQPERYTYGPFTSPTKALLVGLAHCDECGSPIYTGKSTRKGARPDERVYTCSPGHVFLPVEFVEGRVGIEVARFASRPEYRAAFADRTRALTEGLQEAAQEVELLEERLTLFTDDYADGVIDRATFIQGTTRIRERLSPARERLAALEGHDGGGDMHLDAEYIMHEVFSEDTDKARQLLRRLVSDIRLVRRGKGSRAGLSPDLVKVIPADPSSLDL